MFDIMALKNAIDAGDAEAIAKIIKENDTLSLTDSKLVGDKNVYYKTALYWDMMQLIKKTQANAAYGAIGNPGSRWFDQRISQSTTLGGRCVVRHQSSKINELITGKKDHIGQAIIYGDTDSIFSSAIIKTHGGEKTVEELFLSGDTFWNHGDKEYSKNNKIKLLEYDSKNKIIFWSDYNYVYRHKTSKQKFKINTTNGKSIIVTGDHSIMILDENENLIEKKASQIKKGDKIISLI